MIEVLMPQMGESIVEGTVVRWLKQVGEPVQRDEPLLELVHRILPLPAGADITVTVADAAQTVPASPAGAYDVVVSDVYEGAQMSLDVATADFAAGMARVLRPEGICVVNVTDEPPLAFSRVQAATLRGAFADLAVLTMAKMLVGRRFGNVVLAATNRAGGLPKLPVPTGWAVFQGADAARFTGSARPLG